jgi:hypothetical protein
VANKQLTITGVGEMKILANNITFQPGGRFVTTGTDGATSITLDAAGFIDIQSQGTSKSKIDVSGNNGGGNIMLHSAGNLTVNGTLIANATNVFGFGGSITLLSDTGNISVTGDPSEGLKSFGNAQGSGGSITLTALLGSISINTQIVPKGGDCSSCFIDLFAGQDITSTAQGLLDMRASGFGDGGELSALAGGNINLAGNILANASSDDFDSGDGGSVDFDAGGNIVLGGRIELNGAGRYGTGDVGSVDSGGGTGDFAADGDITMNGPMFAISKGYGSSDDFDFDAGGNVTFNAEIDLTGDVFGANLTLIAEKVVTINGPSPHADDGRPGPRPERARAAASTWTPARSTSPPRASSSPPAPAAIRPARTSSRPAPASRSAASSSRRTSTSCRGGRARRSSPAWRRRRRC